VPVLCHHSIAAVYRQSPCTVPPQYRWRVQAMCLSCATTVLLRCDRQSPCTVPPQYRWGVQAKSRYFATTVSQATVACVMHLQSDGIINFTAILTANNTFCNKRPYSSLCHTVQWPVTITFFFLPSYHSPNEIRKAASGTHSFARTPYWC